MRSRGKSEHLLSAGVDTVARTRQIASISVFAALAIMLHVVPLRFPAPFAPFLFYELWEVPIMAAFLLLGPSSGIGAALINWAALQFIFTGALPTGPVYNLLASLGMFTGVLISYRTMRGVGVQRETVTAIAATVGGAASRVAVMSLVNFLALPQPFPIGFSIPVSEMPAMLGLIGVFNASVAAYTIPLGHMVSRLSSVAMRTRPWNYVETKRIHLI